MAILFYEGLPGAGKSYEAMVTQIIPFLLKGREVVTYIEGLETQECRQRIAEASGLPLERVEQLLFPLTRDDMRPREVEEVKRGKKYTVQIDGAWIEKTRDNAVHVFDEAQNWWPNRLRATEALTQFVTEHRHRGIDILLMGQSLMDVLALWRRRVDQKFTFLKLTALGADKRYRVTVFKGQGNDEFVKVTDKVGKYDPKYFGTYKSHVSDDTNTETYTDNRVNVLKSGAFKYGAVLAVAALVWGGNTAWKYFHPEPVPLKVDAKAAPGQQIASPGAPKAEAGGRVPQVQKSPQERYFGGLSEKARARLAGLIEFKGRTSGTVEWVDGGSRVIERISLDTMRDLGVAVVVTGGSVRLALGDWSELATMWPIEPAGRLDDRRQDDLRQRGPSGGAGEPAVVAGGPVVLDNSKRDYGAPLSREERAGASQARVPKSSPWSFQTGG